LLDFLVPLCYTVRNPFKGANLMARYSYYRCASFAYFWQGALRYGMQSRG